MGQLYIFSEAKNMGRMEKSREQRKSKTALSLSLCHYIAVGKVTILTHTCPLPIFLLGWLPFILHTYFLNHKEKVDFQTASSPMVDTLYCSLAKENSCHTWRSSFRALTA